MFILFMGIAAIFMTQLVGNNAQQWPVEDQDDIKRYFGSLFTSMLTMFQFVTLDNWSDISALVAKELPFMPLFFIGYILTTAFVMIALLTGVVSEHVATVSQDAEAATEREAFMEYVETLKTAFETEGADGLDIDQMSEVLESGGMIKEMRRAGLKITHEDMLDIFRAMDVSGDGKVSWGEFKGGLQHIQGHATAKELAMLRADFTRMSMAIEKIQEHLGIPVAAYSPARQCSPSL